MSDQIVVYCFDVTGDTDSAGLASNIHVDDGLLKADSVESVPSF